MNEFTVLKDGDEVAEVSIEGKKIRIRPKNLIKNLSLLSALPNFGEILKAVSEAGYTVSVKKGPFKITLKE